jgi:hypothetical protein
MKNHLINKKEWKNYFDQTSKHLLGHQVELEIVGLDIGDQIEEEWINLEGLSYDPKENILFVHTAETDHPILTPMEVIASEEGSLIRSIVVRDSNGNLQIMKFRKPFQIESGKQGDEIPVTLY